MIGRDLFKRMSYAVPVALVISSAFVLHALHLWCIAEDAFITFRFADNLARGHGIVWNPGEGPVEGSTSFLMIILSAISIRRGLDVEIASQILGVIAGLLTLVVVFRFSRDILGMQRRFAFLPCLLLSMSGPFATWATSGMETTIFSLLVVSAIYCSALSARARSQVPLLSVGSLLAFLATLARPEGLMVYGILMMGILVHSYHRNLELSKILKAAGLSFAVPFLIYFAWRYSYFGFLLPNTFYAKTGGGVYQVERGVKYVALFAVHYMFPFTPLLSAWLWQRCGTTSRSSSGAWRTFGLSLCWAILVPYTVYIVAVGGDYMAMYRFIVPMLPLIYLVISAAGESLLCNATPQARVVAMILIGIGAAGGLLQSTPLEMRLFRAPEFMHGTYRGVLKERWSVNRNRVVGRFLGERSCRQGHEAVGLFGIGVMSYLNMDLKVRSITALVDPVMAHRPPDFRGMPGHEKQDLRRVLLADPGIIVVHTEFLEERAAWPIFALPLEPQQDDPAVRDLLETRYRVRSVLLTDDANGESGFLHYFERTQSLTAENLPQGSL